MKSPSTLTVTMLTAAVILGSVACSRGDRQAKTASPPQETSGATQAPPAGNPPAAQSATPQDSGSPVSGSAPAASLPAAQTQVAQAPAEPPPLPPQPKTFELPAGSSITVRTMTALSTKTLKTGDSFQATLSAPLVVRGVVIAPKGADVAGTVVDSDPGGRVKGVASLSLRIQSIRSADGQTIRVHTNSVVQEAKSVKKRNAVRTGVAAGAGAGIGALAGGGKGAAIGAGVGGGAGVVTSMATRGAAAELPAESALQFVFADSTSITEVRPGSLAKKNSASP